MTAIPPGPAILALLLGIGAAAALIWWIARAPGGAVAQPDRSVAGQPDRFYPDPAAIIFEDRCIVSHTECATRMLRPDSPATLDDWARFHEVLDCRFPDLPLDPESLPEGETVLTPIHPKDEGQIILTRSGNRVRLELSDSALIPATAADLHRIHNIRLERDIIRKAADQAPKPLWLETPDGQITWANRAYRDLARHLGFEVSTDDSLPVLFDPMHPPQDGYLLQRMRVAGVAGETQQWFDLSCIAAGMRRVVTAQNVDAIVQAEIAQRNFVQTLAKTFAHLSTGLAIFNRDRQLALFNPALIDLTRLPADFLSSRPTINGFFDRLRENQFMPEPKDYANWRERIGKLVAAASDGQFEEVWSPPCGRTFRVSGRPHPDGAVAFMIEDISQEISLTRNFRSELKLSAAVLDEMSQAVAVFTVDGVLAFTNQVFRDLWAVDPDGAFADMTIRDAMRLWQEKSVGETEWGRIESGLHHDHPDQPVRVQLLDGRSWTGSTRSLPGGGSMVLFSPQTAQNRVEPA